MLEVVHVFMRANKIDVAYEIAPRRPGDIAQCFANPKKAEQELGWKAEKELEEMCRDAWRFVQK